MHFPCGVPAAGRNLQQPIHIPNVHFFFLSCLHPVEAHTLDIPGACGATPTGCVRTFCTNSRISEASAISLSFLSCSSWSFCSFSCYAFVSCSFSLLSVSIRSRSWAHSFFSFSSVSRFSCSNLSRPAPSRSSFSRLLVCLCECLCVYVCVDVNVCVCVCVYTGV